MRFYTICQLFFGDSSYREKAGRSYRKAVEIIGVPAWGRPPPRPNLFTPQELLDIAALREYLDTNFAHGTGAFYRDHYRERGPVEKFFLGGFGP